MKWPIRIIFDSCEFRVVPGNIMRVIESFDFDRNESEYNFSDGELL